MSWFRFDDKKPKKGSYIVALGFTEINTTNQWLWYGFYNTDREEGCTPENPVYWLKISPFPIMPQMKETEVAKEIEQGAVEKQEEKIVPIVEEVKENKPKSKSGAKK